MLTFLICALKWGAAFVVAVASCALFFCAALPVAFVYVWVCEKVMAWWNTQFSSIRLTERAKGWLLVSFLTLVVLVPLTGSLVQEIWGCDECVPHSACTDDSTQVAKDRAEFERLRQKYPDW